MKAQEEKNKQTKHKYFFSLFFTLYHAQKPRERERESTE